MPVRETIVRASGDDEKKLKKRKLLKAALDLFTDLGYSGTTIAAITKEAGESTGTFYLYFKSKVEIYRRLFADSMKSFEEHLDEISSGETTGLEENIKKLSGIFLHFYTEHRPGFLIMFSHYPGQTDFSRDQILREELDKQGRRLLRHIERLLFSEMDDERKHRIDSWNATLTLWGMIEGIILINERNGLGTYGSEPEELVRYAVGLSLKGLLNE